VQQTVLPSQGSRVQGQQVPSARQVSPASQHALLPQQWGDFPSQQIVLSAHSMPLQQAARPGP
jgi:hypothetical protein